MEEVDAGAVEELGVVEELELVVELELGLVELVELKSTAGVVEELDPEVAPGRPAVVPVVEPVAFPVIDPTTPALGAEAKALKQFELQL